MTQLNRKTPLYRIALWGALVLCLIGIWYLVTRIPPNVIAYGDSVQYWAAGRLSLKGENPYSAELVLNLRYQAGNFDHISPYAIAMVLYPPWTLPFLLPFGVLDYPPSRLLWFIFHLVVVFFSARLIWRLYRGPDRLPWVAYLVAFSFTPTLYALLMGHFSTFHLAGVAGFLYFITHPRPKWWFDLAAGACATLVTFKPQLLYLFLVALVFWVIEQRRWLILVGMGLFIILGSSIPVLLNPGVFGHYWEAISNYPVGIWATPTIGMVIRRAVGYDIEWLQMLPSIFGLLWFLFYWRRQHKVWDWRAAMPVLILASFVTSSYMWPFDMVALLLPVLAVTIELIQNRQILATGILFLTYIGINSGTVYHFLFIHNYYYLFWLAPAWLGWYLLGELQVRSDSGSISEVIP